MLYSHYFIQHVRSHHKIVATPEDASTARFGETLHQFIYRAIPGGLIDVWNFESKRLSKGGASSWELFLYNRAFLFCAGQTLYLGAVWAIFGQRTFIFHLVYSSFVVIMLESVNYIEHYGLERKFLPGTDKVYESVNITHSWNAPQYMSNYILFKLQRHSDHHANAYKPY